MRPVCFQTDCSARRLLRLAWLMVFVLWGTVALAQTAGSESGREIYMERCFWCHGEEGLGDGPSAVGMFPRPRDLVRADYKIRSTHHGQLPTDEDLFDVVSTGLPGTPMPGWEKVLTSAERRSLVEYIKSLSPRFQTETPEPITIPSEPAAQATGLDPSESAQRGEEIYQKAKCFLCHGEAGRGDGQITTTLNFEWGWPHAARDFTRGWTFKGGHEPSDIYLRITGGLNGTPMGPYRDLLTDEERWDVAHYISSLDQEPTDTSEDFAIFAALIDGPIPKGPGASEWVQAKSVLVPLAGQVILDPPLRWLTPTAGSLTVRSLWNGVEIAFLLEWSDPTGPGNFAAGGAAESTGTIAPDSALLQFAAQEGSKPYLLFGDADRPVVVWHWQARSAVVGSAVRTGAEGSDTAETWTAVGSERIDVGRAGFQVVSMWKEGRWQVIFRGPLDGEPGFERGKFVPVLFSLRDGANAETDNVRAISTWLFVALERPESVRPWLVALAYLLGAVIIEVWILSRIR